MSNVFEKTDVTYFQMPQALVRDEHLQQISLSALKLYCLVLFEAQRRTRLDHELLNEDIERFTGLSANSVSSGRNELVTLKLVRCKRGFGGRYTYTLLNPDTGTELVQSNTKASTRRYNSTPPLDKLSRDQYRHYFKNRLARREWSDTGSQIYTNCPFPDHDDRKPSMSINLAIGKWTCHGCGRAGGVLHFEQYLSQCDKRTASKNISRIFGAKVTGDLLELGNPEAIYDYVDEQGEVLFQTVRYTGKQLRQRRPAKKGGGFVGGIQGVRRVLYRLPEVLAATRVIITEGEKDADNVAKLGLLGLDGKPVAVTTNPLGAGKWLPDYSRFLEGKDVLIFCDADESGLEHADDVANSIRDLANTVDEIVFQEPHKDVSDYLEEKTAAQLVEFINQKTKMQWLQGAIAKEEMLITV